MESMLLVFLALVGIPLLGFIVSTVLMLSAQKELEAEDKLPVQPTDNASRSAKLLVLVSFSGTKIIYGFMQGFLLMVHSGALSGAKGAIYTLDINLTLYCTVCAVLNLVTVLADGLLAASCIKNGALTLPEVFSKSIIKMMLPEFLAILGLLYSTLTLIY